MSWCRHLGPGALSSARASVFLLLVTACSAGVDTDDAPEFSGAAGGATVPPGETPAPGSATPRGNETPLGNAPQASAGSGGASASPVAPGAGTPGETPPPVAPPVAGDPPPSGEADPGGTGDPASPDPGGARFGLGGASRCDAGAFAVCEGFEGAAVGSSAVAGWLPAGYGNRTLRVVDVESARGARALEVEIAENQGAVVAMLSRGNLGALSARHFGRSFLKIEAPAPTGFVHFDVFEARGSYGGQDNLVRWASTGTNVGTTPSNWSWIYNVQSTDHGEFGTEGPRSAHPREGDWMCLEWMMDSGAQEAQFWFDDAEVDYLHIDTERAEIPAFSSFNIGFQKFQQTGAWRVWVDEVAFDAERIGCDG
jgi:hypothetical protein